MFINRKVHSYITTLLNQLSWSNHKYQCRQHINSYNTKINLCYLITRKITVNRLKLFIKQNASHRSNFYEKYDSNKNNIWLIILILSFWKNCNSTIHCSTGGANFSEHFGIIYTDISFTSLWKGSPLSIKQMIIKFSKTIVHYCIS